MYSGCAADVQRNWAVIAVSLAMFGLELVGDKVPAFDLIWNALHTFIRSHCSLSCLRRFFADVTGRATRFRTVRRADRIGGAWRQNGARAAITPSPEPFSNLTLSCAEDMGAVSLLWAAMQHPYIAATIVVSLLLLIVVFDAIEMGRRRAIPAPGTAKSYRGAADVRPNFVASRSFDDLN